MKPICPGRGEFSIPKFIPVHKISWKESYRHPNWLKYKAEILKRDRFVCRKCKMKGKLHVHHKKYTRPFPWSSPPGDLITLCDRCHKWIHSRKSPKKRGT